MFGVWFMVLTITSTVTSKEVKQSSESQRVTMQLQTLTTEIQNARKSVMNRESFKKVNFDIEAFKKRILVLNSQ